MSGRITVTACTARRARLPARWPWTALMCPGSNP